jgi:hypothetical protein
MFITKANAASCLSFSSPFGVKFIYDYGFWKCYAKNSSLLPSKQLWVLRESVLTEVEKYNKKNQMEDEGEI